MRLLAASFLKGAIFGTALFAVGWVIFTAVGRPAERPVAEAQVDVATPTPAVDWPAYLEGIVAESTVTHSINSTAVALLPTQVAAWATATAPTVVSTSDAMSHCLWLQAFLSDPAMRDAGIGVWTATILMEQPMNGGQSCKAILGPQSIY